MTSDDEHVSVTKFREYLRINTEQPKPDYYKCKDFLYEYGKAFGYNVWSYECVPGKPFVGFVLKGQNPDLPSLLLYSHTDVVPTFREHWTYDPYSAHKDEHGNIYARGTQDMKSVGVQYMEALRALQQAGKTNFLRTIHIVWGPDEEIGGRDGMNLFVNTDYFKNLNVGFALDEGLTSEDDVYRLFYAERSAWWLKITCPGAPGHGSRFIENTAGPKLQYIITKFEEFRKQQKSLLESHSDWTVGDVTSVNLTKVEGGVQVNVIPSEFFAYFDVRVTPKDDYQKIETMIANWCKEAGEGVKYEFEEKGMIKAMTPATKEDPWWSALSGVFDEQKLRYNTEIFTGATDSRYLRNAGHKAIGFSPMINTPRLLHDHNEFLNEKVFLNGVQLYAKIIDRLANLTTN